MELPEEFVNDLGTICHDVSQLMEACNEAGIEVDVSFTKAADRLGRVEDHIATMSENTQTTN